MLADQRAASNLIGLGEHHRGDFAISAPDVVLAAIAGQDQTQIRLGSAVTVLSSDDPIRVFQRFSTLDAVSNGRAEVILGRGSFTESFPLFGYDLKQYESCSRRSSSSSRAAGEERVTWGGTTPAAAERRRVFPEDRNPTAWIGVGGSPESVVRAARYGLPLTLAIIGGDPRRFATFMDLYYRALDEMGQPKLPVGVHSPGYVADTDAAGARGALGRTQ